MQQTYVPIDKMIKQLRQEAAEHEWNGDLARCDLVLQELNHVITYQIETGSKYFPLF